MKALKNLYKAPKGIRNALKRHLKGRQRREKFFQRPFKGLWKAFKWSSKGLLQAFEKP
jgi:hypothetical protein